MVEVKLLSNKVTVLLLWVNVPVRSQLPAMFMACPFASRTPLMSMFPSTVIAVFKVTPAPPALIVRFSKLFVAAIVVPPVSIVTVEVPPTNTPADSFQLPETVIFRPFPLKVAAMLLNVTFPATEILPVPVSVPAVMARFSPISSSALLVKVPPEIVTPPVAPFVVVVAEKVVLPPDIEMSPSFPFNVTVPPKVCVPAEMIRSASALVILTAPVPL